MEQLSRNVEESASRGHWAGVAAVVIWAVVALWKSNVVPLNLPVTARPFVALGLGQAYAIFEMIVSGMKPGAAIIRGVVAAAVAIAAQEGGSKLAEARRNANGDPPPPPSGPRYLKPVVVDTTPEQVIGLLEAKDTDPPPPPKAAAFAVLALAVLLVVMAISCTPQARDTTAAKIEQAKPVCRIAREVSGSDLLELLCDAGASFIPGVLRSVGTEGDRLDPSRPTAPVPIYVRRENIPQLEALGVEIRDERP